MKNARIINIPKQAKKIKEILDAALSKSFNSWVDEKGTKDNPGVWKREPSKLSFEEAFKIIQKNKPHWVISFRNISYLSKFEKDYWEFGGCNIGSNDYGEVFIWIQVEVPIAKEIFTQFNLQVEEY